MIPDSIIDQIRSQERGGIVVVPEKFQRGVSVRTRDDQLFGGSTGIVDGMSGQDRVWVLLRLMERVVRINFRKVDLVLA
jgi:hypothetical protein